jgi:hypothetical protein
MEETMSAKTLLSCAAVVLAGCVAYPEGGPYPERPAGPLRNVGEQTWTGYAFPESVGCDPREGVLYVSNFGGTELKPGEKDGKGYIMKVGLDGRVIEPRAFNETLNKPKGITLAGDRLWVTDIDGVWLFDTKTKRSRKLPIPGIVFANDPAVVGNALYVSDNRGDAIFRVEPADFLDVGQPKITTLIAKQNANPNGLWPTRGGSLLMAGFGDQPRGIQILGPDGTLKTVLQPFGKLDGLYQLPDGSLLFTDWAAGHLAHWSENGGLLPLAKDFKGPADFCVMNDTVYVPDLVKSEIRVVRLTR